MAKLYPPYIEGTIPAFYGNTLIVPFTMNQAVSLNSIEGIRLKLKTITSNLILWSGNSININKKGN